MSRNVNTDERTEWCCVHDIQSYPVDPDDDQDINDKRPEQVVNPAPMNRSHR